MTLNIFHTAPEKDWGYSEVTFEHFLNRNHSVKSSERYSLDDITDDLLLRSRDDYKQRLSGY